MKLSYFPHVKQAHTSKIFYVQIYMPSVNWLLMIGTVVVTAAYSHTTKLGHAYGVCVILLTFINTSFVALVALIIWREPLVIVIISLGALDRAYMSFALTKVPDGAWFTLALAAVLSTVFICWRFGKEQQWHAEASERFPLYHMLMEDATDPTHHVSSRGLKLTSPFGGFPITRIHGIGVFFDKSGAPSTTPTVFLQFLQKFRAAPDVTVFFHSRPLTTPTIPPEERYTITRCFVGKPSEPESMPENAPMSTE